jgi:hypothetical protein
VVATGVINGVGAENNNRLHVPRGSPFQVVNSYSEGDLFEPATPASAESHFDLGDLECPGRVDNAKIRVLTRVAFGFRSPEALIAMAMLAVGGCCPPLPGRS